MRRTAIPRPRQIGSSTIAVIERRLGLTVAGLLLLGFGALGWVVGRALASRPVLFLVYSLFLLVGLAWVFGRRAIGVEVIRSKVPARVREGQAVEVELGLRARRRLATVVFEEVLPRHLGGSVRFPVPLLPAGDEVAHTYTFTPDRRGRYEVGPLIAEWSDPFGLTRRRVVLDEPIPIIVHPSTERVLDRVIARAWEDPPLRPPRSKPWPTGFEFYGMRDYVSGDDPRRIVWRATARSLDLVTGTGRYLVREAEQGITDRIEIYLDTHAEAHSPGETSETFETAVRAAASLGLKHLKDGYGVRVVVNGGRLATNLRGRRAELELLDRLAGVDREKMTLARTLDRLMVERGGRSHNIVITPHIDKEVALRLRLLLDRGTSVLLALAIWEDTDPATIQRAGTLGCTVVELYEGTSLETVFRHAVGGRR